MTRSPGRTHPGERVATAVYTSPALVYLILLFVAPLALVAGYSFLDPAPEGPRLTLENYRRALDPLYLGVLWHSVRLAFATTLIALLLGFPCVLALRELSPRARMVTLALLIVPSWLNLLVKNYSWIVLLRREGLLNRLLVSLGVVTDPLPLLFNDGAVLVGLVHTFLPFMILPLYAAIDRMDWALVEAARDLGATRWATFRHVILPQTRVGVLVGSILVFIPTLGAFVTPDLLGGPQSLMIANIVENQVLQVRNWPLAAALSILLMVLGLVGILVVQRGTRGATADAR
jgi:spermidine/putrescine transport system permease protein